MDKWKIIIELLAASLLALSKYYIMIGHSYGRWLSMAGYTVSGIYLLILFLPVSVMSQWGLLMLSMYWYYKREIWIEWLQSIDYWIIIITILLCAYIWYQEFLARKPLWYYEICAVLTGMTWFILLAFHLQLWRYFLIINLCIFNYIFWYKKSYIFLCTQTIAIWVICYWLFNWRFI